MRDHDLRWAFRFIAPYWARLAVVLGATLLGTGLTLAIPYLSKGLVDEALLALDGSKLVQYVGLIAAVTVASYGINVVSGLIYTRTSAEILFDMRLVVYRHLQRLSPRFYATTPMGQIMSRINADISEIQRVASDLALAWVSSVFLLLGTAVMMIVLDWQLFLAGVALLPPAIWALVVYRRRLEGAVAVMRERSANIGSFLIETLQANRLVASANAQDREATRFRTKNDAFIQALMAMRKLTYLSGGLPGLLVGLSSAVVFLYGGFRVISGVITLGTLVAFVAYQMRLLSPIQGLMGLYASLATAKVSLRRVREIIDYRIEVRDADDAVALDAVEGNLALDGVSVAFRPGVDVLRDVTFTATRGETVAIVGPSGSGKSTIADLLVRLLDPQRGMVTVDGLDVRGIRLHDLRSHVALVDQDPFVFHASVAENVRYARPDASDAEVAEALRAAGAADFVDALPHGQDTGLGEQGRTLSAGERQRLAIARAFVSDPAILVLDEATASLDPETERDVARGYEALMRGRTTVLITHRLDLASRADRVLVLHEGRVVEQGAPTDLLAQRGRFRELFTGAASPDAS